MKELSNGKATDELAAYGDLSTMAKYAMLSRRAMEEYGTGPEVWKEISIAQRRWANLNPQASMYKKVLDDQGYYDSAYVVEPLRLLDATPNSDGGRAIVLTTAENARVMKQKAVLIRGFGNANLQDWLMIWQELPLKILMHVNYTIALLIRLRQHFVTMDSLNRRMSENLSPEKRSDRAEICRLILPEVCFQKDTLWD